MLTSEWYSSIIGILSKVGIDQSHEYKIIGAIFFAVFILGIILGCYKKIHVYKNYNDLGISLLLFFIPLMLVILEFFYQFQIDKYYLYVIIGLEVFLLTVTAINTYKSNNNVLSTLLALFIKMPLSLIFTVFVLDLMLPGKKRRKSSSKGIDTLFLLALAPIIMALIKDHEGVFKPSFITSKTRINH